MGTTYTAKFLKSAGQPCIILRTVPYETKISMRRSTRAIRDYGARESHFEVTALREASIRSGELIETYGDRYLVQTAMHDHATGEAMLFMVKTNAKVNLYRLTEGTDENRNIVRTWPPIAEEVDAYGEIATAELRNRDPGLLETTRYTFQLSTDHDIRMFDRVEFSGESYRVDAVNDIGMAGVARIQVSLDRRA